MSTPRAVGVRASYDAMPEAVRAWVEETLGTRVASRSEQVGGMSPGCATRVVGADGTRAFVKAVGTDLNPDTPGLFRREAGVLRLLGDHPIWAGLVASYDDGDWVALLLEDVEGSHPDLHDDATMGRLLAATDELGRLMRERVPRPPAPDPDAGGLLDLRQNMRRWSGSFPFLGDLPRELVPRWLAERADDLGPQVAALAEEPAEHLVHWDIRNDNLLQRADGAIVFIDWGMAGVGPDWLDPLLARLERVDDPWFDASLASSPALARAGDERVTTLLVGIGAFLAYRAHVAVDVNMPTLNDFRRSESERLLAGAARRLGLPADLGGPAGRC